MSEAVNATELAKTLREAQETYDNNLFTSFISNVGLSLIVLLLIVIFHRVFPHIYHKRSYIGSETLQLARRRRLRLAKALQLQNGGQAAPVATTDDASKATKKATKKVAKIDVDDKDAPFPPLPKHAPGIKGFLPHFTLDVWKIDDDSLLETHGLDIVVFLIIIKTMAKLSVFMVFPGFVVAIANIVGRRHLESPAYVTGLATLSLTNVPNGSWLMVTHAIAWILVTFVIYWQLYKEFLHVARLRQKWRALPANRAVNQTVMFTAARRKDAPDSAASMSFFRRILDGVMHPVKSAPDHAAATSDSDLAPSLVQASRVATNFDDVLELQLLRQQLVINLELAIAEDNALMKAWKDKGEAAGKKKPEPVKVFTGLPLLSARQPGQEWLCLEIARLDAKIQRNLKRSHPASLVKGIYSGNKTFKTLPKTYTPANVEVTMPTETPPPVAERKENFKKLNSGVVFATFSSPSTANLVGQTAISLHSHEWKAKPAVEPEAVMWGNLSFAGTPEKILRMWVGRILVILLIVFWMIPVSVVSAVSNIETLRSQKWLDWLLFVIDLSPVISGIISGILPQLALIIFMILLIPIINFIVYVIQGRTTRQSGEAAVFQYLFAFQVLNVVLGSILAGSALGLVQNFDTSSIIATLADAIPPLAGFFISYVMVLGLTGKFIAALDPAGPILYYLMGKLFANSARQFEVLRDPAHFAMPGPLSGATLIFIICVTYSMIAPIILPFGMIAESVLYTLLKRDFYYNSAQNFDTGGAMWVPFVKCVLFGLIVAHLVLSGLFGLKNFGLGSAVSLILAVFDIILLLKWPRALERPIRYGALREVWKENKDGLEEDGEQNRLLLQDLYVHPALLLANEVGANPTTDQSKTDSLKAMLFEKEHRDDFEEYMRSKVAGSVDSINLDVVRARLVPDTPQEDKEADASDSDDSSAVAVLDIADASDSDDSSSD